MLSSHMLLWILVFGAACGAWAQSSDLFTGTWVLNPKASNANSSYVSGVRTYTPIPNGVRVSWEMTRADGSVSKGSYDARCDNGVCTSDQVKWKKAHPKLVSGEVSENGRRLRYERSVDGAIMTIKFTPVDRASDTTVQVWERKPQK